MTLLFSPRPLRRHWPWLAIALLFVAVWILGFIGFTKAEVSHERSWADRAYLSAQLFVLESGSLDGAKTWELQLARVLAPLLTFFAALQALASRWYALRARLWYHGHVVICGLGRKGLRIARAALAEHWPVIVLERNEDDEHIPLCRELGALVLVGDATTPELLRTAQVHRAKFVVAVTGDDGVNAEVAVRARRLARPRRIGLLNCLVHVVDPDFCRLLIEHELDATHRDNARLDYFNVFDQAVKELLDERPPFPADDQSLDRAPHLIVVGIGRFGESLIVQAARHWVSRHRRHGQRLRITVVDRVAEHKVHLLRLGYPKLDHYCDLIVCQMDVRSPAYQQADFLRTAYPATSTIYVCLDNDSAALTAALAILPRAREAAAPVIVRTAGEAGLATLLDNEETGDAFDALYAFPLLDRAFTADVLHHGMKERLAQAIHARYLTACQQEGQKPADNPSMVPWEDLSEDNRDLNREQADDIGVKLRLVGCGIALLDDWGEPPFEFTPAEIDRLAKEEHTRWMEQKKRQGYKYAPGTQDIGRRTHPDLLPWDQLFETAKKKDLDTAIALPQMLAEAGFRICRRQNC